MLWKTHIWIAYKILNKLGLPTLSSEANQLREGSIAPDKWKDYPHHYSKSRSIKKYILEARKFFLLGDLSSAYFHLGVVLHYIQDSYTSLSPFHEDRFKWEQEIQQACFVENLEDLVRSTFRDYEHIIEEYMERIKELSSEIEGKEKTLQIATLPGQTEHAYWGTSLEGSPNVDLNFAYRVSLLISKSVLGSKTNHELQEKLENILKSYQKKLNKTEILSVEEIIEVIKKRNDLEKRKNQKGVLRIIKGALWFRIWRCNFRVKKNLRDYENKKHLERVADEYISKIEEVNSPYHGWYNIFSPQIELDTVKNELLTLSEASKNFGINETDIDHFIEKKQISCYTIQENNFIRKSEFEEILKSKNNDAPLKNN